jgi:energy-coupling factor transport system ATP-binding protein
MIKIEHLNFIYQPDMPFETSALTDINLEIETGDFVALIGHTGSGKSTLIQHLNALIKPTSGKIEIDGCDITAPGADLKQIRRKVGLVFQYPEHQLFEETVYRDIAFGPANMGLSDDEIHARVLAAAESVGIGEELLEKSPFELSGGQKRRVAIAGVLAMEPGILILDEPTAGLDPHGRDSILSLLKKIYSENKKQTVIFVSHSMEDVAKLAKHVIVLNHGTVAMHGTVGEVFSRSRELAEIGLNVPQITKLIHNLRERGINLPDDIFTVDKAAELIEAAMREVRHA